MNPPAATAPRPSSDTPSDISKPHWTGAGWSLSQYQHLQSWSQNRGLCLNNSISKPYTSQIFLLLSFSLALKLYKCFHTNTSSQLHAIGPTWSPPELPQCTYTSLKCSALAFALTANKCNFHAWKAGTDRDLRCLSRCLSLYGERQLAPSESVSHWSFQRDAVPPRPSVAQSETMKTHLSSLHWARQIDVFCWLMEVIWAVRLLIGPVSYCSGRSLSGLGHIVLAMFTIQLQYKNYQSLSS